MSDSQQQAPDLEFEKQQSTNEFFGLPDEGGFEEAEKPADEIPEQHQKKTRAELAAELDQAKEQADLGMQLRDGVKGLRESFREQPAVAPVQQQQQQQTAAPTLADLGITNDTIFDNSVENIQKLIDHKNAPWLKELAERDLKKDRRLLTIDPATAEYARSHIKEIDEIVKGMQPGERYAGNAYDVAFQRHQAGNQDEVLATRMVQQVEKSPETLIAALEKQGYNISKNGAGSDTTSSSHSETGSGGPPARQSGEAKRRYKMSKDEALQANNFGVDIHQFVATRQGVDVGKIEISNEREVKDWLSRHNRALSQ